MALPPVTATFTPHPATVVDTNLDPGNYWYSQRALLVDGATSGYLLTGAQYTNVWFVLDLGSVVDVSAAYLSNTYYLYSYFPKNVRFEWSTDNSTWHTALEHENPDANLGVPYTWDTVQARYIRFTAIDNFAGAGYFYLEELRIGELAVSTADVPATDLWGWYRADDLTQTDGTEVAYWPDASGNDHNMMVNAYWPTGKPTFETDTFGSLPALLFADGDTLWHWTPGSTVFTSDDLEIFAVVQRNGAIQGTTNRRVVSMADATHLDWEVAAGADAMHEDGWGNWTAYRVSQMGYGPAADTTADPHVVCSRWTGTQHIMRVDGTDGTPVASTGTFAPERIILGNDTTAADTYLGYIGEILIYTRTLTSGERTQVEDYLTQKWITGATANQLVGTIAATSTLAGGFNRPPLLFGPLGVTVTPASAAVTVAGSSSMVVVTPAVTRVTLTMPTTRTTLAHG